MPYFLEYVTGVGVGHFTVEGMVFSSVLAKAKETLKGLDCLKAVLLYSPDQRPAFGKGSVLAAYTQGGGWRVQEPWPQ